MLLFEPRPRLAESSVTVAPVRGGEVDDWSGLTCEEVLDGTLNNEAFFCDFSGTAGAESATFSLADEVDDASIGVVCKAASEVVTAECTLSGEEVKIQAPAHDRTDQTWCV